MGIRLATKDIDKFMKDIQETERINRHIEEMNNLDENTKEFAMSVLKCLSFTK